MEVPFKEVFNSNVYKTEAEAQKKLEAVRAEFTPEKGWTEQEGYVEPALDEKGNPGFRAVRIHEHRRTQNPM